MKRVSSLNKEWYANKNVQEKEEFSQKLKLGHAKMDKKKRMKLNKEISDRNRRMLSWTYLAISPTGEKFIVEHLKSFCKIHNLSDSLMTLVVRGGTPKHKGWLCYRIIDGIVQPIPLDAAKGKKPIWQILSPDNILHQTTDLKRFCQENSLVYKDMANMWRSKRESCLGWKILGRRSKDMAA